MTKRKIEYWVIPPEQDAEFVACMEEVLETYAEAYDPMHPVVCMDEQPVQLLKETQVPIAPTKEHGERDDPYHARPAESDRQPANSEENGGETKQDHRPAGK